jgi:catechol 2,3-dioxygenase-like lactoylglutathione lyase family enzyme
MFSHIMIGSNDMARSKRFYDALFAAMGSGPGVPALALTTREADWNTPIMAAGSW